MGQIKSYESPEAANAQGVSINKYYILPRLLNNPNTQDVLIQVWCGSEFTLGASTNGTLWARGWNDHGNLGVEKQRLAYNDTSSSGMLCEMDWTPVMNSFGIQMELVKPFEDALATGGAHCLAFMQLRRSHHNYTNAASSENNVKIL
jgi:hypothetical protein